LRAQRSNDGDAAASRALPAHDAILPVSCPTSQTSERLKKLNAVNAVLLCMGLFSTFLFEQASADNA
jgi:hypothetical protein